MTDVIAWTSPLVTLISVVLGACVAYLFGIKQLTFSLQKQYAPERKRELYAELTQLSLKLQFGPGMPKDFASNPGAKLTESVNLFALTATEEEISERQMALKIDPLGEAEKLARLPADRQGWVDRIDLVRLQLLNSYRADIRLGALATLPPLHLYTMGGKS